MVQITHKGLVGPFSPKSRPSPGREQENETVRDRLNSVLGFGLGIDMDDYKTSLSLAVIPLAAVFLAAAFGTALAMGSTTLVDAALGYAAVAVILAASWLLYSGLQQLKAKEIHNRTIVERAGDGIITTDNQGEIESINPAAEEIFGYRDAELAGCNIMAVLSSSYTEHEDVNLWENLRINAIEATGVAQEVIGLRKTGEKFFMDLSISEARVGDKTIFVAIVRDVTDRKKAQIAVKRAQEHLETRVRRRTSELQKANEQLRQEISERKKTQRERERLVNELQTALNEIKTLSGLIPICASCKKVRDDKGFWNQIEVYVRDRSNAEFSHGICPDCSERLYAKYHQEKHDQPSTAE